MNKKIKIKKGGLYEMIKTYDCIVYEYGDFSLYPTTSSKLLVKNMLKDEFEAIVKSFKPSQKITKINLNNKSKTIYLIPVNKKNEFIKTYENKTKEQKTLWIFDMPYKDSDSGKKYEYGILV